MSEMMTMCQNPDQTIIALAEALGRCRALSNQESIWLERAVRREDVRTGRVCVREGWSTTDDARLIRRLEKVKPAQIAKELNRSLPSVYQRIEKLKKQEPVAKAARKRARKVQSEGASA